MILPLVVFKGDQYIRYANPLQKYVDQGYPKSIANNWGNLPNDFESSINVMVHLSFKVIAILLKVSNMFSLSITAMNVLRLWDLMSLRSDGETGLIS